MAKASNPDWKPEIIYRCEGDMTWPEGWVAVRGDGLCVTAKPTYTVRDPLVELESICSWLEQSATRLEGAELRMTCGDAEFEDGWFGFNSFKIPGHFLTRLRALGIRLVVIFEPDAAVVATIES